MTMLLKKIFHSKKLLSLFFALVFLPSFSFAQQNPVYSSLTNIDKIQSSKLVLENSSLAILFNQAFFLMLAVAIALAIFMIIRGGYSYILSADSSDAKGDAKKKIQASFGGLLLALGAVVILQFINPEILKLNFVFPELQVPDEAPESNEIVYEGSTVLNPTGPLPNINWSDPSQKVSNFFTVKDFTKGDPKRVPKTEAEMRNLVGLANELDTLVTAWGSGFEVVSGLRPKAVNDSVGGANNSQHMHGTAVDIKPLNGDLQGLQKFLKENWGGGVGTYKTFVHIDMRGGKGLYDSTQGAARW